MQISKSLGITFLSIIALVNGHQSTQNNDIEINSDFSLIDLVDAKKVPSTWSLGESAVLEEGRVRLTPKQKTKGSLWAKKAYELSSAFTLEWTFRSVDYQGKTSGGLSFWFLTSSNSKFPNEKSFYNGPSNFDGLQLLVDNNGPLGPTLRAQLNENSRSMKNEEVYDSTFASCLMGYQDSSVPSTIRLTYDAKDNFMKVQVDNRVCFQTRKAKFPLGSYFMGATADNAETVESFEILKVQMFDGVTKDSLIPNVNAMPQPKILTEIVDKATGQKSVLEKDVYDAQNDKVSNFEIYKKLDKVEGKILANDIQALEARLDELSNTQSELLKHIVQLTHSLQAVTSQSDRAKDSDKNEYQDIFAHNSKIEEIYEEQRQLKEVIKNANYSGTHADEMASKLALWIVPLIVIMMVMAYYTFRIRQEIVKTKLL